MKQKAAGKKTSSGVRKRKLGQTWRTRKPLQQEDEAVAEKEHNEPVVSPVIEDKPADASEGFHKIFPKTPFTVEDQESDSPKSEPGNSLVCYNPAARAATSAVSTENLGEEIAECEKEDFAPEKVESSSTAPSRFETETIEDRQNEPRVKRQNTLSCAFRNSASMFKARIKNKMNEHHKKDEQATEGEDTIEKADETVTCTSAGNPKMLEVKETVCETIETSQSEPTMELRRNSTILRAIHAKTNQELYSNGDLGEFSPYSPMISDDTGDIDKSEPCPSRTKWPNTSPSGSGSGSSNSADNTEDLLSLCGEDTESIPVISSRRLNSSKQTSPKTTAPIEKATVNTYSGDLSTPAISEPISEAEFSPNLRRFLNRETVFGKPGDNKLASAPNMTHTAPQPCCEQDRTLSKSAVADYKYLSRNTNKHKNESQGALSGYTTENGSTTAVDTSYAESGLHNLFGSTAAATGMPTTTGVTADAAVGTRWDDRPGQAVGNYRDSSTQSKKLESGTDYEDSGHFENADFIRPARRSLKHSRCRTLLSSARRSFSAMVGRDFRTSYASSLRSLKDNDNKSDQSESDQSQALKLQRRAKRRNSVPFSLRQSLRRVFAMANA